MRLLLRCSCAPCHHVPSASGIYANIWKVSWVKTRAFTSVAPKGSSIYARKILGFSYGLPRVLTMRPGCIICIREITRAGSVIVFKIQVWPKKLARLASAAISPPERAVLLSKQLLRTDIRRQHDLWAAEGVYS